MKIFLRRDRVLLAILTLGLSVFAVLDIAEDIELGEPPLQVFSEAIVFIFAIFGIYVLASRNFLLKTEIKGVRSELALTHTEAKKWKSEHGSLLKGLGFAIDNQLTQWGLSPSEKEIALLLLKGLSFKEISFARGTNEKTVRQQALKVYEKSNLAGRSELSAFFLEDLLHPIAPIEQAET